ncbi:hypothetical protein J0H58_09695 [bacterium]|nr:hypothetical protein [bacterium]
MSPRKRFPEGRHGRPEGGWGCPRAVALWFDRVADDLRSMADGVKELSRMANCDRSSGQTFWGMVDALFGGQSLFLFEYVLNCAKDVANEIHPVNGTEPHAAFPPPAADVPHPWGDPHLHPIPCLHGPKPVSVYRMPFMGEIGSQIKPAAAPKTVLGIPIVGEIDSDDLARMFNGETVDTPVLRELDRRLTGGPKKPVKTLAGGHRM